MRRKVAFIRGTFPADDTFLTILHEDRDTDLEVLASMRCGSTKYDVVAPASVPHRILSPLRPFAVGGPMYYWLGGLEHRLDDFLPDVVHVVSEPWSALSLQAWRWVRRHPSVAFVVQGCDTMWRHGGWGEQRIRFALARRVLDRADAYTAESLLATEEALAAGFHGSKPRAAIHTNPRDPEVFRPALGRAERREARGRLGLPESGLAIGFAGRMIPEKGPELLLDALEILGVADTHPWAAFVGDGPLAATVRSRALQLGHRFCGPIGYPGEMAEFLRAVDIFVAPSWTTPTWEEQGPRAVLEAMLSGCLTVVSRSGALPEIVGHVGYCFDQRDHVGLAEALRVAVAACEDPAAGCETRRFAQERYSSAAAARQLLGVWHEVLTARAARGLEYA